MFCSKCGKQIEDGIRFCPNCGAKVGGEGFGAQVNDAVNHAADGAKDAFRQAESSLSSEINDIHNSFTNTQPFFLKTDRSLLIYILLTIITCGVYSYYFIYRLAQDVNIACEGDGDETSGLFAFILLSLITCGIYAWYWYYKLGNRLAWNAPRYNMTFQENGTTVLLWCIIGVFVCGIGPYIGMYILIKNTNLICDAYNRSHGLYQTY